jgi:acyl-CoA dehydrogenase
MDFTLSPEIEDIRLRTRRFVEQHVLPLESERANYDEHENIRLDLLAGVRDKAKAQGLWGAAGAGRIRRHGSADRRLGCDV